MIERFAGRYALLQHLGRGGMGDVYLARDLTTGTECALKRLHGGAAQESAGLMEAEFRLLTRVRHPAVVSVYELGFAPDGSPFFTMEYVPGLPADRAIARGDLAAFSFAAIQFALGVEVLHSIGIVHGDLKPSNLLILPGTPPGSPPAGVRLVDFGLARLVRDPSGGHRGTPGFAAPEVVRGDPPSTAADLYGLGATLFALATGQRPFSGSTPSGVLRQQQSGPPSAAPLEDAGVPAALAQLILRLLSPIPDERGDSVAEIRRELERIFPAARRPLAERLSAGRPLGRERELASLESWLVQRGTSVRLQILTGAPGTGVSTLIDELAARAAIAGRRVIRLSGAMRAGGAARALARRLMSDAGVDPSNASVCPPSLRDWLASEDSTLHEDALSVLTESAIAWLAIVERDAGAPLLLVDDSDALDPISRALLRRLLLAPEGGLRRAVWARHGSASTLADDERAVCTAGFASVIELGPLARIDVARFVASKLCATAPPALVDWLWERGAGDVGLTLELLRHAAAAGAVVDDDTGLRVSERALESTPVPASFESSLLQRWSSLPAGAREAAAALAAWGRAVAVADLRELEPRADDAALDRLVSEGLATRDESGAVAFSPPALAVRVLEALDPPVRLALHEALLRTAWLTAAERFEHLRALGRTVEALAAAEVVFATRPDHAFAVAAASLCEDTAPGEAARWLERAARVLFDRARHSASVAMIDRALELDPASEARHARRALLAQALFRTGDIARLDSVIEQALADAPPAAARARLLMTAASVQMARGRYEDAERGLRDTLVLCESVGEDVETGIAAMSLASALLRLDRTEEAEAAAAHAVACHRRAGHERGALRAQGALAAVARHAGRYEEAQRRFAETLAAARTQRERFVIEELLGQRAALWAELGRWRAAREDVAEALQLALEDGRAGGAAIMMTVRAELEGLTGRGRAALRHARAALRMTRSAYPAMRAAAMRALAQAHRNAGRLERAERVARRCLSLAGAPPDERDWGRYELGRTLLASGRFDEVRALRHDEEQARPVDSPGSAALCLLIGRARLRLGEGDDAERLLAAAEAWRDGRPLEYLQALAAQLRAELALVRGRIVDGAAAATSVLDAFARLPAPADRAMAALDFARLIAAQEDDDRLPVARWLEESASGFQRLGDLRSRERALALLVRRLKRVRPLAGQPGRAHGLINAVGRLLNSLSDLRELAKRAMQLVVEQLDAERGVLLLAEGEDGRLVEMAEHGAVDALTRRNAVGYSRRVVERVAKSGGVVLLGDAVSDPASLSESIMDMHLHSILCVPMYVGGRVLGAVYLDDSRRADAFSDDDRALLEGFAQLMAVAFEQSRGHEAVERANQQLVGENIQLRLQAGIRLSTQNLIAMSSEMQRIVAIVDRVAGSDATVLLTGENGTGKELIALTLHHASRRHDRPFVAVNCGAIPESLLESELFGILPHVATGVAPRIGRFEQANGGTLFLDEIADMPAQQQVALLRVLSNREVTKVGGGPPIPIDVRIIAATNRDVARLVETGEFREDLYHRLNVIPIEIPPLRERKADIPSLAHHFVSQFAKQQQREMPKLSPELLAALMQSDWPGNVRALQNYIERIMAMNPGVTLHPNPLPRDLEGQPAFRPSRSRKLAAIVEELELRLINEALAVSHGNQSLAARKLGLTEQSLRYRLRKYSLVRGRRKQRIRL